MTDKDDYVTKQQNLCYLAARNCAMNIFIMMIACSVTNLYQKEDKSVQCSTRSWLIHYQIEINTWPQKEAYTISILV